MSMQEGWKLSDETVQTQGAAGGFSFEIIAPTLRVKRAAKKVKVHPYRVLVVR
jgi:hypothetical protein